MNNKSILRYSFLNAFGATAYISLVATFLDNTENFFVGAQGPILGVLFLLVFVISAGTMAMLVFGRPLMWYLDGRKHEAVSLAISTVLFLIIIALSVFIFLISIT